MPHTTVGQCGTSFSQRMVLAVVVYKRPLLETHGLPVGLFRPQKVLRFLEHCLADELFVAQGEREDSR